MNQTGILAVHYVNSLNWRTLTKTISGKLYSGNEFSPTICGPSSLQLNSCLELKEVWQWVSLNFWAFVLFLKFKLELLDTRLLLQNTWWRKMWNYEKNIYIYNCRNIEAMHIWGQYEAISKGLYFRNRSSFLLRIWWRTGISRR